MKKNLIITIFLFFQLISVSYTFPLSELLSDKPIFYVDNGFHWYYLKLVNNIFPTGAVTGYDPFFNAGTPGGIANDISGHIAQLLLVIFNNYITEVQAWKICVFFTAIIGPILPGISLRVLNFSSLQIIAGLILGMLIWWTSWFHWFHVVGMISYVFSSFSAMLFISLLLRFRNTPTVYNIVFTSIFLCFLIFIHALSIIPVCLGLLAYFIINPKEILQRPTFLFILTVLISGILLNLWWLIPYFSPTYDTGYNTISYQALVKPSNIFLELMGFWTENTHGSKLYPLLLLLSIIAIFRNSSAQRKLFIWPFLLCWAIMQVYAATAGLIPILARLTQPNRFAPTGYLLLIIPAVLAIKPIDLNIKKLFSRQELMLTSAYILVFLLTAINFSEFYKEVSYGNHGHYAAPPPQVQDVGPYSNFVLSTLEQQTDTSARVLFENSLGRIHDGSHLSGYYAYLSNREFIGGPYPHMYFANFWDGFVFSSPIKAISTDKFMDYLRLYNIRWILAHSNESKTYFKQFTNLIPGPSFKELQFYTVNEKNDFFMAGSGVVKERKHNLLKLTDLSGDNIEIKYHYFKNITSNHNVKIEPVYKMNDPIPFIKIVNPPKSLDIYINP